MAGNILIEEYTVGEVQTNCFFIINPKTKEALIIDPGAEADFLARKIRAGGYQPVAILLTHGHFDHADAVADLKAEFDIPVYAYEAEKRVLEDPMLNLTGMWGIRGKQYHADRFVKDGDILELAGYQIKVLFTPGHTPGGCCYYFDGYKVLASGDTLFAASVGRTDFPEGSMSALVRGIREKLLVLPGDTEVLPGHMGRTTIGYERQYNPFL